MDTATTIYHFELRYRLSSITYGYFDLISLVISAPNEQEARSTAEHILEYHEFFDYEYLGFRYTNHLYREAYKEG